MLFVSHKITTIDDVLDTILFVPYKTTRTDNVLDTMLFLKQQLLWGSSFAILVITLLVVLKS